MKLFSALTLAVLLMLTTSLMAKGATTRITIRGSSSGGSIDITDPTILREFNVWSGPGTSVGGVEGTEGFIIDWSSGIVTKRPTGLQHYEVSFFANSSDRTDTPPTYVVFYEHDAASNRGYVYLPGKGDEQYPQNAGEIYRGHDLEGKWFVATKAFQTLFRKSIVR
jgi:hypothetical protein